MSSTGGAPEASGAGTGQVGAQAESRGSGRSVANPANTMIILQLDGDIGLCRQRAQRVGGESLVMLDEALQLRC